VKEDTWRRYLFCKQSKDITMKKLCKASVVTTLAAIILTACAAGSTKANDLLGTIKQRGYILVSTDPEFPPQSSLNTEGKRPLDTKCPADALTAAEMQGFDVDAAVAIGTHLDVETCFVTPGWNAIVAGGWQDKWDVSVGSMTITTERQKLFDFSIPYYYTPAVVALRADAGFTSLDDLAGQTLCVGESTTYETWLNHGDMGPNITVQAKAPEEIIIVPLDTDQRCPNAITAGRKDFVGYVTSEIVVDANIAEGMPVVKLDGPVFYERLAAALDMGSSLPTETLRAEIDKLFVQMHSDRTLSELSKKWFKDANGEGVDYTVESK
jgi:polar amino acid transport system substrate-binding protein